MKAAATKGKLFSLAAALLAAAAALLLPTPADASRYLPTSLPAIAAPQPSVEELAADVDDGPRFVVLTAATRGDLAALAAGARLEEQRFRLPATALELAWSQKTASGGVTPGAAANDWGHNDLAAEMRWSNQSGQNLLFQGLWTDPATGISYARARWYDARNANWLSEDPLADVDSPNLYAFVAWGPHVGADPMGWAGSPRDPEWHHLLGNTKRIRPFLDKLSGISRNSAEFGVVFEAATHRLKAAGEFFTDPSNVHRAKWNSEVADMLERLDATGSLTPDRVRQGLGELMTSDRFRNFFEVAVPAEHSYSQWGALATDAKVGFYRSGLRRKLLQRAAQALSHVAQRLAREGTEGAAEALAGGLTKKVGRRVPVGGLLVSGIFLASSIEAKGVGGSAANEALELVPFLNFMKLVDETATGRDWIMDSADMEIIRTRLDYLEAMTGSQWRYARFGYSVATGYGYVGEDEGQAIVIPEEKFDDVVSERFNGGE